MQRLSSEVVPIDGFIWLVAMIDCMDKETEDYLSSALDDYIILKRSQERYDQIIASL